ncbi:MAG: cyclopropane-fatty-acyl-phospholipid synthase family protein [Gammaproteobacteria bacterium]
MSALEKEVASSADRAGRAHLSSVPTPPPESTAGGSVEGKLLRKLLSFIGNPAVEFILWTGERISTARDEIVARIRIADRATLFSLVKDPHIRFGDAYSEGRITIDGDLLQFIETMYKAAPVLPKARKSLASLLRGAQRQRRNTLNGSKENIHHHYDIGNDFYKLWLGSTMAYTCAYYPTPETTLDEAQIAKFDHICQKMQLRAGETVVEAGFGWGGLALHMARAYGVKVRAFNISHEQVVFARERAAREGLGSQLEYVEDDYRNITGHYDAFVSVGMLEHVGVENYPQLGGIARQVLGSNGRGLIHSIGRNRPAPLHPWITKRIFPGAYPPSLAEFMQIFEPWDFSILDVENLRLHYARTLIHWLELFDASANKVRSMFDDKFERMWRLYLAGSIAGFTTGTLQLFQVLFAPKNNNDMAMTRDHLYVR